MLTSPITAAYYDYKGDGEPVMNTDYLTSVDEQVTDGKLVTAPAWPAHPAWLAAWLTVLEA